MKTPENVSLKDWLSEKLTSPGLPPNIHIHTERPGARTAIWNALKLTIANHYHSLDLIKSIEATGEFSYALEKVRTALPQTKRVRSGDLAEILATEYVTQFTQYTIPIRKLRYKDDRNLAMRGDDIIAIVISPQGSPLKVLKGEVKSKKSIAQSVVKTACTALEKHDGRPNPASLSFVARRLDETNNDSMARIFNSLQEKPPLLKNIEHLIFTLSENDPLTALTPHAAPAKNNITRKLVGFRVTNHQSLIEDIFSSL
ncbi:Hachiman antiphage defense system protein HamA [Myxococcus faecalis]|uniref:Hachiman antiphage defense system protein HamA n=1 Tax=Myxococcus faecalis TaxID=3115646 RepID=UPI003CE76B42